MNNVLDVQAGRPLWVQSQSCPCSKSHTSQGKPLFFTFPAVCDYCSQKTSLHPTSPFLPCFVLPLIILPQSLSGQQEPQAFMLSTLLTRTAFNMFHWCNLTFQVSGKRSFFSGVRDTSIPLGSPSGIRKGNWKETLGMPRQLCFPILFLSENIIFFSSNIIIINVVSTRKLGFQVSSTSLL